MIAGQQRAISEEFFAGGGEMGALMRSHDWAQTPVGAVENWPQSLKTAVRLILDSRYPMFVWWGQQMTNFYNDAYIPVLGKRHPQALGQPASQVWAEIWDTLGPQTEAVLEQGQATWNQELLLLMERNGYPEETYFTFSYSPVANDEGVVGGVFCACSEETQRVLSDRRLRTLRQLATEAVTAKTVEEACEISATVLTDNTYDIPFALFYLLDHDQPQARLVSTTRLVAGTLASPEVIALTESTETFEWPLKQVIETGESRIITDLKAQFGFLPGGVWSQSPNQVIVLPLARSGETFGFLIAGVSPLRAFDDHYKGFFDLMAGQVTTAIANARAYEEERKRAEALAELDRAKTTFFSNISHEFRTPLTLMLGPLNETLSCLDVQLPASEREQLQMVQRNGQRLLKLVNTLLDFSRIEAGRIQAVYELTDLAAFTAELASVFRACIERVNLRFLVDCPALSAPTCVDREMWEKIVLNLLSNAFKFTFAGEIAVTLRECNDQIELEVRDTGTGIPAQELPHIFERFHRVRGAKGRTYEGSGIGLALVQELVRLQGGTIRVSSVVDQGTSFIVSIPAGCAHLPPEQIGATHALDSTATEASSYVEEALRWLPEEELQVTGYRLQVNNFQPSTADPAGTEFRADRDGTSSVSQAARKQESGGAFRTFNLQPMKARILLVDDNTDMRDYVKRLLLDQGYRVETAADGMAALAAVEQQAPDLVLTDVMMPRLDGFGLLRELRSEAKTRDIPIILLSARAGEEARIEGLEAGADDYLTKPFSARELLARVEANLKLAQLRRDAMQQEQVLRLEAETAKQKVETILSSINDGFYVLDRNWHYTYVNDRLCEMAGMQREEMLGQSVWELFPAAVDTDVYVQFQRSLSEQTPLQFEYLYPAWNRWFEHRVYPSSSGLSVFIAEITARKQTELLLVEQKRLLELIASGHPLDECLSSLCSSVSKLSLGVRACLLLTDAQRLMFPRSITPDFPPSFGQGLKDAPINELAIGTCGTAVYCVQPITCANITNDARWSQGWRDLCVAHGVLACHSAPVLSVDNLPLGSLMLCFDEARLPTDWEYQLADFGTQIASIVFERDRSSFVLRESEHRYCTLFETIDEGFCICEMLFDEKGSPTDYRFLEVNPAFEKMTGLYQATGKTARELVPDLEAFWFETYGKVVLTGEPVRFENQSVAMQGWFDVNAFRVGEGQSNKFALLFTKITERKQAEAALRDSEERLRQAIAIETVGVIFFKTDGRITETNDAFLKMSGYSREETEQGLVRWDLMTPPEWMPHSLRAIEEFESTGRTTPYEKEYIRKNGSRWWALFAATRLSESEGVGFITNITARKQAEMALRQSEAKLQILVDNAPGMIYRYAPAANGADAFTYVSSGSRELFELEPEILLQDANSLWTLIHPDDQPSFQASVAVAVAHTQIWQWEGRVITPSAQLKWIQGSSRPVQTATGKVWDGLLIDITALKRTEAALRQSEAFNRQILDSSDDCIKVLNLQGLLLYINPGGQAALKINDFTPFLNSSWAELWQGADRQAALNAIDTAKAGGVGTFQGYLPTQTGEPKWWDSKITAIKGADGQVERLLCISRDISDRKQAEIERDRLLQREQAARAEAEKANRIKDEFLAVLSHELRSPLNPILGWSQLLQTRKLDEAKTKQALTTIERNAKLQSELIEDLLDVSRILQGKLNLNVSPVDLASTLQAAIGTVQLAAEAKSIQIEASLALQERRVSGDATRLQQVVWNLLSNAVKFTPEGGRVVVRLEQVSNQAQITVSDTGKGIHPDFLPYVFDYFRQEDSKTTRQFGGLGLGLAIVRHLVELHGGTVLAQSQGEELGATFTVRLPLMSIPVTAHEERQLWEGSLDLQGVQILVVDDDTDTREFIAFLLAQAGAGVKTATTAEEALAALTQFSPDVLLSDIGMPDLDGYTLIRQVRALSPEQGGQVRAIALTAYAGDFNQQQALQAGFQQHLSKPVEPMVLVRAIVNLLNDN